MSSNEDLLRATIEKLIQDAHELMGTIIGRAEPSDQRARRAKVEWTQRHPLLVWFEAAQESLNMLPRAMREPWLPDPASGVFRNNSEWRTGTGWKENEASIVNPSEVSHLNSTLMLAARLRT